MHIEFITLLLDIVVIILCLRVYLYKPTQIIHVELPTPFYLNIARFMTMAEVPMTYYATGNCILLDRTLLVFDGSDWIKPKGHVCPTCGK